jgi:predicted nucleic acid-binding Zn ribbon protein
MNTKKCPVCSAKYVGRSDKKYCSDYCRNAFNNKVNSNIGKEVRKVNRILRKNRDLLNKYLELGMEEVSLFSLISDGFVLTYFTNVHKGIMGDDFYFCYDLGYQLSGKESVLITKKSVFEKELVKALS